MSTAKIQNNTSQIYNYKNPLTITASVIAFAATLFLTLSFLQINSIAFYSLTTLIYGPIAILSALIAVKLQSKIIVLSSPQRFVSRKSVRFQIVEENSSSSTEMTETHKESNKRTTIKTMKVLYTKKTLENFRKRTITASDPAESPPMPAPSSPTSKDFTQLRQDIEEAVQSPSSERQFYHENIYAEVCRNIYWSDFVFFLNFSKTEEFIREMGYTHNPEANKKDIRYIISLLNPMETISLQYTDDNSIPEEHPIDCHLVIPIDLSTKETLWASIKPHFEEGFSILDKCTQQSKCLVHSSYETQLNTAFIIAYLMNRTRYPLNQCYRLLQKNAPYINLHLEKFLENYAQELGISS